MQRADTEDLIVSQAITMPIPRYRARCMSGGHGFPQISPETTVPQTAVNFSKKGKRKV